MNVDSENQYFLNNEKGNIYENKTHNLTRSIGVLPRVGISSCSIVESTLPTTPTSKIEVKVATFTSILQQIMTTLKTIKDELTLCLLIKQHKIL